MTAPNNAWERLHARRAELEEELSQVRRRGRHRPQLQRELVAQITQIDVALLNSTNEARSNTLSDSKAVRENKRYWLERVILALQVGNGAGAASSLAGMAQGKSELATSVSLPAIWFFAGLILASAIPFTTWVQVWVREGKEPEPGWFNKVVVLVLAGSSAVAFCGAAKAIAHTLREAGGLSIRTLWSPLHFPIIMDPIAELISRLSTN